MAEKLPETNIPEPGSPALEKKKSDLSLSGEKADESGEAGDSSAQHSSDLLSGAEAESAMETSEDHGPGPVESKEPVPATKKQQKKAKSSKKQVDIADSDSKLESVTGSPDKASRTRSHKKSTSEKETDVSKESDQKTALEKSPPQHLVSAKGATTPLKTEDATPPKSKPPSILMRLRSHSKLRSERSASLPPDDGSTKVDEPKGKAKVEKSSDIYSPAKRKGLLRKAKSVDRERSKSTSQSESMDTAEAEPNLEADEKRSKSKASAKPKLPPTKQEEADANTPTVKESKHPTIIKLLSTTCEQVSSGIQSIQLSKKANDAVPLICLDDSLDSTSSGASGKERIGSCEATQVKEIGAEGDTSPWKPQQSHQEGGFQKDVIWAQFSSSAEDTGTGVSVVSDSAIQEGNELKKGISTSTDTLSEIPGLKEEEASGGQELAEKSLIQGQKRVKGTEPSDSDEDYKAFSAVCGSPVKKPAPERKPAEDSSEK